MRGELRCGTGRGGVVQRSVVWCGVSGAARGRGTGGTWPPPPIACREAPRAGILTFFLQVKNTFYHIFIMKWPKSEEKIGIS